MDTRKLSFIAAAIFLAGCAYGIALLVDFYSAESRIESARIRLGCTGEPSSWSDQQRTICNTMSLGKPRK